jgi:ribosomal protein L14
MTRKMTVMRAAGTEKLPCIKISNQMLEKAGFALGDLISVTYKRNVIVIKRSKDNHHE